MSKDYDINSLLPKGSPLFISFPFAFSGHNQLLSFSPYLKKHMEEAGKKKNNSLTIKNRKHGKLVQQHGRIYWRTQPI
jgi:hypothetical protein